MACISDSFWPQAVVLDFSIYKAKQGDFFMPKRPVYLIVDALLKFGVQHFISVVMEQLEVVVLSTTLQKKVLRILSDRSVCDWVEKL
jgi:hypothetical protein